MNASCNEFRTNLSKYQDSGPGYELLTPQMREAIGLHLLECEACRAELELLQTVTRQVKALPEVEAAPNFTAQVMGRLKEKQQRQLFSLPSWVYSFVFLLFLALGFFITYTLESPGPLNGNGQLQEEMFLAQTLTETQDLRLMAVQDSSVELLASAGNHDGLSEGGD